GMFKTRKRSIASRTDLLDLVLFANVSAYATLQITSHITSISIVGGSNLIRSVNTSYNNNKNNTTKNKNNYTNDLESAIIILELSERNHGG
ncbi:MAG: hypothetical protein VB068_07695, partial [Petrimonas sp.]|nr:hypothetical protein [Petrimonas sp.]